MTPAARALIRLLDGRMPQTALVLGSGLGGLVEALTLPVRLAYGDIEGFPQSAVSGHSGELLAGELAGIPVIVLSGRVHYYERGRADAMRPAIEALAAVGIRHLILTNSAGSLHPAMGPGSVMMIADHINGSGANPLIGEPSDTRFVGLTSAYDAAWAERFRSAARAENITLHEGVYMWFSGPSFETPAEIRAARILGADAVGMSTVPEVILARFCGLTCSAFSVITNLAAGMTGGELSHAETKEMAPKGGRLLARLIERVLADSGVSA
jgi:purine-nucleoside phosphorylase